MSGAERATSRLYSLGLQVVMPVVCGDGTWVDDRGRPALMRPRGLPLHVPVLPLWSFAFSLLQESNPFCSLRKEKRWGRPAYNSAKNFRNFFVKFYGCKLSNFKHALVKIQTCLCKVKRNLYKENLNYPICNAMMDPCHVPHGEGSGFESGAGLSMSFV